MTDDTIVAIATPPGQGGVGIVRLSGILAYSIGLQISQKTAILARKVHFGSFYDAQQELIDQGLILYFKAPHSFTGEDVIEFQTHGSPWVLDQLVNEALRLGARIAKPGEFSERAFLNDKMDLTQAEAIADLIQANSKTAARMAVKSLQGEFSERINALNQQIIHLRMYVEAAIDFPEEEIDFLNDGIVANNLRLILADLQIIRKSACQGALIREGLSIVIAGKPNAGKSTLINQLAGKEVAIVTHHAGTTRDVMREHILLDDIPLHMIDTAGLRESQDPIEQEGIRRAWLEVEKADCVLLLTDICDTENSSELLQKIASVLPNEVPILHVNNKIDLTSERPYIQGNNIFLSAKTGEGIDNLKLKIKEVAGHQPTEGHFLARRRHLNALDQAFNLLINGQNQLSQHRAGELLAEDLRLAHQALGEITGEFSSDDLLGKIFSSFCIGK